MNVYRALSHSIENKSCAGTIVFGLILLFAAQAMALGLVKGMVLEKDRIPLLENAEQKGAWETRDLRVDYRFTRFERQLNVSGVVRLADSIVYNAQSVQLFHMDLIFIDRQGKVLKMTGLTSSGFDRPDEPLHFKSTMALPVNAVAVAFSYRGNASGSGDDGGGGSPFYFWEYPVH